MYSIGSLFYAIYFFVSFPMFMRLDEQVGGRRWSLREVRHQPLDTILHTLLYHEALGESASILADNIVHGACGR
jgi:hypothetical protein